MKADGSLWSPMMNSFNHYSYGAVGQWMHELLGGLSPDVSNPLNAGWKSAIYAPKPSNLVDSSIITYESIYGIHRISWKSSGFWFTMEIQVPANTQAIIRLPQSVDSVLESSGLTFARISGCLQATSCSGRYFIRGYMGKA